VKETLLTAEEMEGGREQRMRGIFRAEHVQNHALFNYFMLSLFKMLTFYQQQC
jgi:hypothetical protein